MPVMHEPVDGSRMRKLRRVAEPAVALVEGGVQLLARAHEWRRGQLDIAVDGRGREIAEHVHERVVLRAQFVTLLAVVLRHALEKRCESRHSVARLVGEIGAAEKRLLVVVREEHRQRPAATALREHLVGELVDPVDVRPLFAIHLDVDEQLVHQLGRGRVLERLVRHDVAPVAGRVTDGQQHWLAAFARRLERRRAPGVPVHGIGRVLLEVGASFRGQSVLALFPGSSMGR